MSNANHTRPELIHELFDQGITDERILHAISITPRERFVPESFQWRAYENEALPIDCGQTISQPYTVARMTSLIEPFEGMKVLEIGTGSGYQAAVLSQLGLRVWSIERLPDLLETARHRLEQGGYAVATRLGDGSVGWSEYAPYDAIIVTAAAPEIPSSLVNQLAIGGRLVIPVGDLQRQRLKVVTRLGDEKYETEDFGEFRFVPLIGKRGFKEF